MTSHELAVERTQLGPLDGDAAPVLSGVKIGDTVILSAPTSIQSGDPVTPVNP